MCRTPPVPLIISDLRQLSSQNRLITPRIDRESEENRISKAPWGAWGSPLSARARSVYACGGILMSFSVNPNVV